ncbi:MAG: hypothetical protein D6B28_11210 [Gammaproteobacteria bacterium]|nr:MAG: hypothetical protein D6B28_11210 [Gammaproteobacteria bacterium]
MQENKTRNNSKTEKFSLAKIREDISNFYNITLTRHEAKRLDGLNVRIERSDYKVTKFFSFKDFVDIDEALRAAIACRNEHYQQAGYPSFLTRSIVPDISECALSGTGWSGIRIREKKDSRRKTSRRHVSFSCPVPETGRITTKDISLQKHNDVVDHAVDNAVSIKRESIELYNQIVPIYNELATKSVEAACFTELRTLNPTLQFLKTNSQRLWEQAYKIAVK